MINLNPVLPEIYLALTILFLLVKGLFRGTGGVHGTTLGAIIAGVATLAMLGFVSVQTEWGEKVFGGLLVFDAFSILMKVLILIASLLSLVMGLRATERDNLNRFEYPVLVLFATLGLMLMVSAHDFMSLYLSIELQSLSLYVLAAFRRDDAQSSEAGLKYFVLGALSSGLMLYGISLIYGFAGSTNFEVLSRSLILITPGLGVLTGVIFVLVGLAFKISAAPFHMWTPDVYQGAPTPVTAFFALAPKIGALALLIRVLSGPFGGLTLQWQQVIILLAVISMIVGALAAIRQTDIKRLLAYSSIGHVGYVLAGLAAGNEAGIQAAILYLMIYLFMNAGAFAVVLAMRKQGKPLTAIADLSGVAHTNLPLALAMLVLMFSMAGIPPMAGFFAKFFVFQAAIQAGPTHPVLYAVAIIGVLTSVVSAFYYLRIIRIMWADDSKTGILDKAFGSGLGTVLTASTLVIFPGFLFMAPKMLETATWAAHALVGG